MNGTEKMQIQNVRVKVLGIQRRVDAEPERIEMILAGTYYYRDGFRFLRYEEYPEESGRPIVTYVKFKEAADVMEVIRKGEVNSRMVFEEGREFAAPYSTPFGTLQMKFAAGKVWMTSTQESWSAGASYMLTVNGEYSADCEIRIEAVFCENTGNSLKE